MTLRLLLATFTAAAAASAQPKVSFNRDIRPIMSDTCFHCHGFDAKTREAGLRLDIREEALKKTENDVLPIVPGKPEESEIIKRIMDNDDPMPPDKAHKPLSAAQRELFRRWVAEGAAYEPHWAYAPLTKPTLPVGSDPQQPIDAFIQAKLKDRSITPSPEAPKAKLLRRLSLDLTGLPPSPHEVAAFLQNSSPAAYAAEVDRLLASPHFGERMAVWWLDIARFADTVGFHGDQNQRIFPYRDYVIKAFNDNKRFDAFTIEQLAGDLLPNPSPDVLVATGYNRLNMMTREGGAQPKEYLAKYGAERVRSVAAAWFGSTFGCAECHDHKFDPIKTRDFYELQSFFADVKQWGVYSYYSSAKTKELEGFNNEYPFPPEIEVASPVLTKRYEAAKRQIADHIAKATAKLQVDPKQAVAVKEWQTTTATFLKQNNGPWLRLSATSAGRKGGKSQKAAIAALSPQGEVTLTGALGKGESLAVTLPVPTAMTIAAFKVKLDTKSDALGAKLGLALSLVNAAGKTIKLPLGPADATAKRPNYAAGAEVPGITGDWNLPKAKPTGALEAIWLLATPTKFAAGDKLIVVLTGDCKLPMSFAATPIGALEPMQAGCGKISSTETYLLSTAADRLTYNAARKLTADAQNLNGGKAWSLVTQSDPEPLTIRVLPRGNWQDESGAVVLPATPSFLPGRLESTDRKRLTRLDLAQWLVSKANPITARAVTNRLWQQFFGIGLSAAVDDLGSQGELPSHPELLDWLASDFRDNGWNVKELIRLIVTSHTYKQNSSLRPELKDADPNNRLLASQNPRRLDAEFIRDNALAIAGGLNLEDIGGPSVMPYQPIGYYEALQFPSRDYIASTGGDQWRRGVYMHWQRTFLHPMLANFDAPARDECAALRTVSNTPQQALTLLNDPTFVEAARMFATRLMAPSSDDDRLIQACDLAWSRQPNAKELSSLTAYLKTQRDYYTANPAEAAKFIKIGNSPVSAKVPASELAAWTSVCRVLLNAQETITRY